MSWVDRIKQLPRAHLFQGPTPLQPLHRLSRELGGPTIYIKRDDCTQLALGGNKTRKLEFVLGQAQRDGATAIITCGAPQSNHARQTAAACAKLGLACALVLAPWTRDDKDAEPAGGNLLLDCLLGATVFPHSSDEGLTAKMEGVAQWYRDQAQHPFLINAGASTGAGSVGYAQCAIELIDQFTSLRLEPSHLVTATGSCGTQAGLMAGFALGEHPIKVIGIAVSPDRKQAFRKTRTSELFGEVLKELGQGPAESTPIIRGDYCGPDYGVAEEPTWEAISMMARLEAILLDPVYSGKAMAGLIGLVRAGFWERTDSVVFLHTGGTPILFDARQRPPRSRASKNEPGAAFHLYPAHATPGKQTVDQIS